MLPLRADAVVAAAIVEFDNVVSLQSSLPHQPASVPAYQLPNSSGCATAAAMATT